MAWLAIDKSGRETISNGRPVFDGEKWYYDKNSPVEDECEYVWYCNKLPSGTIKKLLGRQITFEESPIKIQ